MTSRRPSQDRGPADAPPPPGGGVPDNGEERYRLLVESVKDYAIFLLDPEGKVATWNVGAQRIKGYAAEEIIGQHFSRFYPPEDIAWDKPAWELRKALAEGRFEDEGWRLRKDGSRFWANVVITALFDESGRHRGFAKVTRDLTERRRAEEALREKNAELERALRARDHFLAGMSHELRTPLNAILGFTGTLLMKLPGPLTADQERQLRTVQSSARHLLALINGLLDLAKVESGKLEVRPEPVDCREVVREVAESLRPLAQARGLRLDVAVPPGPAVARTDRRVLSQILLNLVNNAIKFTDQGRVTLELARAEAEGRPQLAFSVSDTGVGISAEDQGRLFQAFTQLHQSAERHYGGTGLGLYLSQRFAALLGTAITVTSRPGEGSRFSLLLPEGAG